MAKNTKTLVLGGARSGKSAYAETLGAAHGAALTYIATAQAWDDEMKARIATHIARRGADWTTVEAPVALPEAITENAGADGFILVDCLTLWLTNVILGDHDVDQAVSQLKQAVEAAPGRLVLVSNEVGLGIVPDNPLGRRFRDEAGRLNQRMAEICDQVVFIAAGMPLKLKPQ
ncbi:MAG: bifunctional adenosylcobinamide kinase/adenosylcobinamide-phosphate guanylyltransferase [Hyphomicrobiales bacterium]